MRKVLIELLKVSIISLICCLITTMIIDKRADSNEKYEKLVIEEVIEIYGSDVYGYTIEELEFKTENKDVKYLCLVRFYDGETYVERIMYVVESGNVFTEEIVLEVEE